jgi:uncharacterized protein YjbI with pentapeptide repeats
MEFGMHQDQMAQQRLQDEGGYNGDRIAECRLATLVAQGTDWLKAVVEKSDLAGANLSGARVRETLFTHTALRKARFVETRLERVEFYFDDLNEFDGTGLSAKRCKWHGCEAMNATFKGAQISVSRFEDSKLYRANFQGAILMRTAFLDGRAGGASLEKSDFSGARLVDVQLRSANLMGASFKNATLIGVDLTDAGLAGCDFTGASLIACLLPAGFSLP